ncbi:MAG: hypothetical protein O3A00_23260 [Planctomycetota bacterium]|nr:hypothetical protein [Planctomycetota bacterium]
MFFPRDQNGLEAFSGKPTTTGVFAAQSVTHCGTLIADVIRLIESA